MSDDLYGVFYEDINYAADGGLYAELVRNRSFEFAPTDNGGFTGMTGWDARAAARAPGHRRGGVRAESGSTTPTART